MDHGCSNPGVTAHPPSHGSWGTPEFYASLPTKSMSAGCVFTDDSGRILLLKPTYREAWDLPGGVVEAGESPYDACRREIREELGLDRPPDRLLGVDYRRPVEGARGDALRFVFAGGVISAADAERITLDQREHSDRRFVAPDALDSFLIPAAARRIRACLAGARYLEEGSPVPGMTADP